MAESHRPRGPATLIPRRQPESIRPPRSVSSSFSSGNGVRHLSRLPGRLFHSQLVRPGACNDPISYVPVPENPTATYRSISTSPFLSLNSPRAHARILYYTGEKRESVCVSYAIRDCIARAELSGLVVLRDEISI